MIPSNPLQHAVHIYDHLLDAEASIMFAIGGQEALDEWDDILYEEVMDLIYKSAEAVSELSPRAKYARLNLIWKDFIKKHKELPNEGL